MKKTNYLKDYNEKDLNKICSDLDYPKFHGTQIYKWLYQKGCKNINLMSDIPIELQAELKKNFILDLLSIHSTQKSKKDNTVKFLLKTLDDNYIETVSMIEEDRHTVCISSQIGCNVDCDFCATGKMGLIRNLSTGEIIEQLLIVKKNINKKITNIVFMGMGEPFLNYKNVIKSCEIFTNPKAFNLGTKRITISTAGILSKIKTYIKEEHKYKLAISLNASNNKVRSEIMPINNKWSIQDIIVAIQKYKFNKHRVIMFEYVLLDGLNDNKEDALELSSLLKNIPCKINLIPFNSIYGKFKRPTNERINNFSKILHENRGEYRVFIRWSKGEDIDAACGQLATKTNE